MTNTVKLPRVVIEEIDAMEFQKAARKHRPGSDPKYQIDCIVSVVRDFGRKVPGVVVGVDSRSPDEWHYSIICPDYRGVLERLTFRESQIEKTA